jgi:hypothetical protein
MEKKNKTILLFSVFHRKNSEKIFIYTYTCQKKNNREKKNTNEKCKKPNERFKICSMVVEPTHYFGSAALRCKKPKKLKNIYKCSMVVEPTH